MIADKVTVTTKALEAMKPIVGSPKVPRDILLRPVQKNNIGTEIVLTVKENTEDENYDEYLEPFKLQMLVKKYSDSHSLSHQNGFAIKAIG